MHIQPIRADHGLTVIPTDTPDTVPQPDLIAIPGSDDPAKVLHDRMLVDWVRRAAPAAAWTASACTGAGLYAAAGFLSGKTTTTHWAFRYNLRAMASTSSRTVSPGKGATSVGRACRQASTWCSR